MKQWLAIIAILLLILLTACVQGDIKLKVNKDGSALNTVTLGVEEEAYDKLGSRGQRMVKAVVESLETQGYQVESFREEGYVGFKAAKSYKDIKSMEALAASDGLTEAGLGVLNSNIPIDLTTEEGLFMDTYKVETVIDLQQSGLLGSMQQLVSGQVDLTFTLDLPVSPKRHNADMVDGNELKWKIAAAGETPMMVEIEVPNVRNILVVSLVGVLLAGILLYLIRRKKRLQ